jgi:5-methylcytosine-specific restriction endonuclease McrA
MNKPRGNPRYANGARRRAVRRRVLAAYDTCHICGKPVDKTLLARDPWSAEVDELLPVSKGGSPYEFSNCKLAHRVCNELRGNKSIEWARQAVRGQTDIKATSMPFRTSTW